MMRPRDVVKEGRVGLQLGKHSAVSQRTANFPCEQEEYSEEWEGDKP